MKKLTLWPDLEALFNPETGHKTLLFKHSLICGTSSSALAEVLTFTENHQEARILLLEIQPFRELSNEIASRSGVPHRSPQALVFQEGQVIWHASHWQINSNTLAKAMGC